MFKLIRKITAYLISFCLCFSFSAYAHAENSDEYNIITDIVYSYRTDPVKSNSLILSKLHELKKLDLKLGRSWESFMSYWSYANTDLKVHTDGVPDWLPDDSSLCIVVLGFQLNPDGTMAEELEKRCETALSCANKYPNAHIAVTGGGTAFFKRDVTEAGCMSDWLIRNGIDKSRIITEDSSQTTVENALYTGKIILDDYPEVNEILIVSSDYHVPLGCLLFTEFFTFSAYSDNTRYVRVISNAAYAAGTPDAAEPVKAQGMDVWSLAETLRATGQR